MSILLSYPEVDPSFNDYEWIKTAVAKNNDRIVELILQSDRVNLREAANKAINEASWRGNIDIVNFILQDERIDPQIAGNIALNQASIHGHANIVRIILKDERIQPDDDAIQFAEGMGETEIVKLLLEDGRSNPATTTDIFTHAPNWGIRKLFNFFLRMVERIHHIMIMKQ